MPALLKFFRLFVCGLFLVTSIFLFVWILLPQQREVKSFSIPEVEFLTGNQEATSAYSLPQGTLEAELTWSNKAHLGEQTLIEFIVFSNAAQDAEPPPFLSTQNLVAEARIDFPLAQITPSGDVRQALKLGYPVRFEWKTQPQKQGTLEGKFWFYLILVSDQDGKTIRQAILAVPISTKTISLANLPEGVLIWVMAGSFLVSALLFIVFAGQPKIDLDKL